MGRLVHLMSGGRPTTHVKLEKNFNFIGQYACNSTQFVRGGAGRTLKYVVVERIFGCCLSVSFLSDAQAQ